MIFIFELYLRNRRAKVKAWEKSRRDWVNSGDYRYTSDYERSHPYPVFKWKPFLINVTLPVVVGLIFAGCMVLAFKGADDSGTTKSTSKNCTTTVKKDEAVGVSYGSFQGSKGTVVRQNSNCSVDINLTDSTDSFDTCRKSNSDSSCEGTQENGSILHIDSSDNVIPL